MTQNYIFPVTFFITEIVYLYSISPQQCYIHTVTILESINSDAWALVLEDGRCIALPEPISPHLRPLYTCTGFHDTPLPRTGRYRCQVQTESRPVRPLPYQPSQVHDTHTHKHLPGQRLLPSCVDVPKHASCRKANRTNTLLRSISK